MKLRNKKTGKIVELDHFSMHYNRPEEWGVQPCSTWNHSLAELNEEWEDYKPAEPLIRDKNARQAVRAWAEVNSIKKALYAERTDKTLCILIDMGAEVVECDIEFVGWIPTLKDGEEYTIAELCGEATDEA